jgi:hypothetical protein
MRWMVTIQNPQETTLRTSCPPLLCRLQALSKLQVPNAPSPYRPGSSMTQPTLPALQATARGCHQEWTQVVWALRLQMTQVATCNAMAGRLGTHKSSVQTAPGWRPRTIAVSIGWHPKGARSMQGELCIGISIVQPLTLICCAYATRPTRMQNMLSAAQSFFQCNGHSRSFHEQRQPDPTSVVSCVLLHRVLEPVSHQSLPDCDVVHLFCIVWIWQFQDPKMQVTSSC